MNLQLCYIASEDTFVFKERSLNRSNKNFIHATLSAEIRSKPISLIMGIPPRFSAMSDLTHQ